MAGSMSPKNQKGDPEIEQKRSGNHFHQICPLAETAAQVYPGNADTHGHQKQERPNNEPGHQPFILRRSRV